MDQCTGFLIQRLKVLSVWMCVLGISSVIVAQPNTQLAVLELVLQFRPNKSGFYRTYTQELQGTYSTLGEMISAEGDIRQFHPLSLCRNFQENNIYRYGCVGFVKLEGRSCKHVYDMAKKAVQKGATAMVFDVTDSTLAERQLQELPTKYKVIKRPIIFLSGNEASKLMKVILSETVIHARIFPQPKEVPQHDIHFLMFTAPVMVVLLVVVIALIIRWRRKAERNSSNYETKQVIAKLKVAKFRAKSTQSSGDRETCSICLEEYKEGQNLRILPCIHTFHKVCVDPWLESNRTCPLCLYNIVEGMQQQMMNEGTSRLAASLPPSIISPHYSRESTGLPYEYEIQTSRLPRSHDAGNCRVHSCTQGIIRCYPAGRGNVHAKDAKRQQFGRTVPQRMKHPLFPYNRGSSSSDPGEGPSGVLEKSEEIDDDVSARATCGSSDTFQSSLCSQHDLSWPRIKYFDKCTSETNMEDNISTIVNLSSRNSPTLPSASRRKYRRDERLSDGYTSDSSSVGQVPTVGYYYHEHTDYL